MVKTLSKRPSEQKRSMNIQVHLTDKENGVADNVTIDISILTLTVDKFFIKNSCMLHCHYYS